MSNQDNANVFKKQINRVIFLVEKCISEETRPNPHGMASVKTSRALDDWFVIFYNCNYYKNILKKAGFIYEDFGWIGTVDSLVYIKHDILRNILISCDKKDLNALLDFLKEFYEYYTTNVRDVI